MGQELMPEIVLTLRTVLFDPLQYPFMQAGLIEVLMLGVTTGLIGFFLVRRNLMFFAHALAHTIFPAVILAAVLGLNLSFGAVAGTAVTVLFVSALRRRRQVGEDSAVGIVFTGLLALGVVFVGLFRVRSQAVGTALVGNLLGIGDADLLLSAGLVCVLAVLVGLLYRPLVLTSFDPVAAQALGLPVALLDLTLLGMVAGAAVVSVKVVGVILTVSLLVAPAATAQLWVQRIPAIMALSAALGAAAGTIGLYLAYFVPVAPASLIVLVLTALFGLSQVAAPHGLRARGALAGRSLGRVCKVHS